MNAEEAKRRSGATLRVLSWFQAHPNQWIPWTEISHFGGQLAWRTRVADARRIVRRDGGDIRWNKDVKHSAYRYEPQAPLGRDASMPSVQPSLLG